jgi:putative transcriptional regulator
MTGKQVLELRIKLGLSQAQLAQILGVHSLTVSKWERNILFPTAHQEELLNSFAKARRAQKTIGDEVAELLLSAGVVVALYKLLQAAFGDEG